MSRVATSNHPSWFYKVSHHYVILLEAGQPPDGHVRLPSIWVQPQPGQPLVEYVTDGDYSCQVMQIRFFWFFS